MLKLTARGFAVALAGTAAVFAAADASAQQPGITFGTTTAVPRRPDYRSNELTPAADSRAGGALSRGQVEQPAIVPGLGVVRPPKVTAIGSLLPTDQELPLDEIQIGAERTTFAGDVVNVGPSSITVGMVPPRVAVATDETFAVNARTTVIVNGEVGTLDEITRGAVVRVTTYPGGVKAALKIIAVDRPGTRRTAARPIRGDEAPGVAPAGLADAGPQPLRTQLAPGAVPGTDPIASPVGEIPRPEVGPAADPHPGANPPAHGGLNVYPRNSTPRPADERGPKRGPAGRDDLAATPSDAKSESPTGLLAAESKELKFGLGLSVFDSPGDGVLVTDVTPDGPAALAGVEIGDFVMQADGKPVAEPADLERDVADADKAEPIALTLWRDGQERQATVRGGKSARSANSTVTALRPALMHGRRHGASDLMGVRLSDHERSGILVTAVGQDDATGLQRGDVILSVNGRPVDNRADLASELKSADGPAKLVVRRDGDYADVTLPAAEAKTE